MNDILNRNEIRRLEKAAREKDKKHLFEWTIQFENQVAEMLRKEYEQAYQDELASSVDTFLIAVAYTAKFSETTNLNKDTLPEFMNDLLVTVDMFSTGEYKPEEYRKILADNGIIFEENQFHPRKNKIITLCGSSRFKDDILKVYKDLTMQGNIVFLDAIFNQSELNLSETDKQLIDDNHKQKISMSDAIYVINKDGYIGDSTKSEIEFAKKHHKEICYLEDMNDGNKD